LLARRLVERGVRFVQLFDQGWDHHGGVFDNLPKKAKQVDQPIAALLKDLKERGLLEDTLVVWNSEFGRTPMAQGISGDGSKMSKAGRDHHKEAYTVWMASGDTFTERPMNWDMESLKIRSTFMILTRRFFTYWELITSG